jgi:hypothetical protein
MVHGLEPLDITRLGWLERVWHRIWSPPPAIRRRRLWLASGVGALAMLSGNADFDTSTLRGAGGGQQPCEMGLSAVCDSFPRS